ncbi:MAG: hypothetical protein ABIL58_14125 [Pseudomonadota bacterium]
MIDNIPEIISEVFSEVQEGYWRPQTFEEWKQVQVSNAIISAWKEQQNSERQLRRRVANWIFSLISCQIAAVFMTLFLIGFGIISLTESMIKVLLPSVIAEIFGMGFIVVKYLFNNSGHNIDKLIEKLRGPQ